MGLYNIIRFEPIILLYFSHLVFSPFIFSMVSVDLIILYIRFYLLLWLISYKFLFAILLLEFMTYILSTFILYHLMKGIKIFNNILPFLPQPSSCYYALYFSVCSKPHNSLVFSLNNKLPFKKIIHLPK